MQDERTVEAQAAGFVLGRPALVCRWRIAHGALPLENRHLRALSHRLVAGAPVSPQLVSWAKQHIEWTLRDGSSEHPDGVLMLVLDEEGQAAMTVGPYKPLRAKAPGALVDRARHSAFEREATGVAPETLWLVRGDLLVYGASASDAPSGASSLMLDLAKTTGFSVACNESLADDVSAEREEYDELFLVSDEHGIVAAAGAGGPRSQRFAAGYAKLLERRPR